MYPINKQQLIRTFQRLHFKATHSPHEVVRRRHRKVYRRWHDTHFPKNASARYSSTWSVGSWL